MQLFSNSLEGLFSGRPNRFLIHVDTDDGVVTAHCPNPGRMEELLYPGARLILEESNSKNRASRYSLAAAYYEDKVIPLNSARVNLVAEQSILPVLFPEAEHIQREFTQGNSRFDFLVTQNREQFLVETKGCTLVHRGVAMFPDAPTLRGTRHVRELSACRGNPYRAAVLFVVMHGDAEYFIPHVHTDPAFSLALQAASPSVSIYAASAAATAGGSVAPVRFDLPVYLEPTCLAEENRGCYLLLLELTSPATVHIGKLGVMQFPEGYYVYTGSAMNSLSSRIARHLRKRKKHRWHIDYLRQHADRVRSYPVYTRYDLECSMAARIAALSERSIPGFGCSDCTCNSHLFYFREYPLHIREFRELILDLRHIEAFSGMIPSRS